MKESVISEKEFEVLRALEENHQPNQRLIAARAGISLGLTNLIIKRLASKGYLKLKQLTPKRTKYLLTPKGLAEKARKSYHFTIRTIETLRQMKQQIQEILLNEYQKGERRFIIYGKGELATLIEISLRDLSLKNTSFFYLSELSEVKNMEGIILLADDKLTNQPFPASERCINIMTALH